MPNPAAALIAKFKALPAAQQALLGVGVPVVAGAALIGNARGKSAGGEGTQATTDTTAVPTGGGPAVIPFGAGLDDLFGLQTAIAKVETSLSDRIDRIAGRTATGSGGSVPGATPPRVKPAPRIRQVVDDTNLVKVGIPPRATPAPSTRAIGRRPAVGPAESVATVTAPANRIATAVREQTPTTVAPVRFPVAARKVTPRPALKAPARKVTPRPALKAPARKVTPRPALKAPARKVTPRPAPAGKGFRKPGVTSPARKVTPRPALKAPARKVTPRLRFL